MAGQLLNRPIPEHFLRDHQVPGGHKTMDPEHQAWLRQQTAQTLGPGHVDAIYGGPGPGETQQSLGDLILLIADQISRNTDRFGETAILPHGGSPDIGGPTPLEPSYTGREAEALRRQVNPQGPVGRRTAGIASRTGF